MVDGLKNLMLNVVLSRCTISMSVMNTSDEMVNYNAPLIEGQFNSVTKRQAPNRSKIFGVHRLCRLDHYFDKAQHDP